MDCLGGLCVVVVVVLDVVEPPVKSSGLVVSSDIKDGVQGLPMLISICQSFLTNRVNHLSSPPPVHRNKAWNRMIQISIQGLQLYYNLIYGIPFKLLHSNFTSICNCTMLQLMEINERLKFSFLSFFCQLFLYLRCFPLKTENK